MNKVFRLKYTRHDLSDNCLFVMIRSNIKVTILYAPIGFEL